MKTEPAWDYRRDFRLSPYIVYDDTDEVYLSDETWQDDLWEARRFHTFEDAHAEAQKHGGAENAVYAYSYAVCENGYLIGLAVQQVREADALAAPASDGLRAALKYCRERFREYAHSHAQKRTPDGDMKAKRNAEMVDFCTAALGDGPLDQPQSAEGMGDA